MSDNEAIPAFYHPVQQPHFHQNAQFTGFKMRLGAIVKRFGEMDAQSASPESEVNALRESADLISRNFWSYKRLRHANEGNMGSGSSETTRIRYVLENHGEMVQAHLRARDRSTGIRALAWLPATSFWQQDVFSQRKMEACSDWMDAP